MAFIFHSIWNNKPNWRTHIFQRGWLNHQPAKKLLGIYKVIKYWSSVSVENPNHMMSFPKDCLGVSSETYWNILKRTETYWNILKHAETCWNILKLLGFLMSVFRPWTLWKSSETTRCDTRRGLKPLRTVAMFEGDSEVMLGDEHPWNWTVN